MIYFLAYHLVTFYLWLFFGFRVYGRERIPEGAAMLIGNHTSLADAVIVACTMPRRIRVRFMGKAELFSFKPFKWLITWLGAYPIERGKGDLGALRKTLEIFKLGEKVLIFPDGTRMTEENVNNAKTGAALLAVKSGVPVLPMYITAPRRFLRRNLHVYLGEPFHVELPGDRPKAEGYTQAVQDMMRRVYALKPTCHED